MRYSLFVFLLLFTSTTQGAEKPVVKLGIVGLDNYQALDFTSQFHNPKAPAELQGIRVVAAYPGGSPDIEESVQSLPKWVEGMKKQGVEIFDSIDKVVERSDAILIMSLDGRAHLKEFQAVVKSGKPVYIGRPMATSLADVLTLFDLAKSNHTPLFSCSQHRFVPGFIGMRNHPEVGKVQGCSVWGGCPNDPLHPDTIWKAVHGVETLYTIMGPGCTSVTRACTEEAEFATGVWKDGRVGTYRGIKKGAITYRAMVFGDKGISPSGDYGYDVPTKWVAPHGEYMAYKGLAIEIANFVRFRQPPVTAEETIEIFTFMEAVHKSKSQGGIPVKLAEVLSETRKKLAAMK
ncbi:Gfo/Idh/MocA family oxidoreductase [Telmatocola sphagniphila]|uniref:Gfo/Idh/MocA family oxidoreductase n=1 Tax=Telmatocola sphagniphila TaxID=1123043 RepID=A0A8E6EXG4_9BACT|nr:Gfo/Idh/MocA family oxidoreductase [Telmatocola sphagniphila]QVL31598.1 Gfo/Idh/MocA family oxidoreductase [Telmatocola sphagniphila]